MEQRGDNRGLHGLVCVQLPDGSALSLVGVGNDEVRDVAELAEDQLPGEAVVVGARPHEPQLLLTLDGPVAGPPADLRHEQDRVDRPAALLPGARIDPAGVDRE